MSKRHDNGELQSMYEEGVSSYCLCWLPSERFPSILPSQCVNIAEVLGRQEPQ